MAKSDDVQQLQAQIAAAREKLAQNIQGLVTDVHPSAVRARAVNDARTFASDSVSQAKATVVDESGVRWDRIGTAVLVVAGVVGTVVVLRGIRKRITGDR